MEFRREVEYRDLPPLQQSRDSLTVVVRPPSHTGRGLARLVKIAQSVPRHRFVLVVPWSAMVLGVRCHAQQLERMNNVFLGYLGGGPPESRVYKELEKGYADLEKRASTAPPLGAI